MDSQGGERPTPRRVAARGVHIIVTGQGGYIIVIAQGGERPTPRRVAARGVHIIVIGQGGLYNSDRPRGVI